MAATPEAAIGTFEAPLPLAVAFSGGADSTALLALCARRWPGQVAAIHVNHGLQQAAADFERQCIATCTALDVRLEIERVDARHLPGESPEDAARRARYEAIHRAALRLGVRGVALAQHADDQVETLLLALSRGAGLAGLAGMRPRWEWDGVSYHRPLLDVSSADLRAWLREREIAWIEDPTNADDRYTRNRIRSQVLPALAASFPSYRDTFARSARHAAQAQALLEEVAADDLRLVGVPPRIEALRAMTPGRMANALRHWLKSSHSQQPSTAQMDQLVSQVMACATRGHDIRLRVGTGFVRRDGERLVFTPSV